MTVVFLCKILISDPKSENSFLFLVDAAFTSILFGVLMVLIIREVEIKDQAYFWNTFYHVILNSEIYLMTDVGNDALLSPKERKHRCSYLKTHINTIKVWLFHLMKRK